jgi:hypothetical protein
VADAALLHVSRARLSVTCASDLHDYADAASWRTPMTYVYVTHPIGYARFARATADQFTAGVLTITSVDDDRVFEELHPDTWERAQVIDEETGWVTFAFTNEVRAASFKSTAA